MKWLGLIFQPWGEVLAPITPGVKTPALGLYVENLSQFRQSEK
jgi:hypothetical protein